jgi:hypothetical protein
LSHTVSVPSAIDSPIWGMMTSMGIRSPRAAITIGYRRAVSAADGRSRVAGRLDFGEP